MRFPIVLAAAAVFVASASFTAGIVACAPSPSCVRQSCWVTETVPPPSTGAPTPAVPR